MYILRLSKNNANFKLTSTTKTCFFLFVEINNVSKDIK